MKTLCDKYQAKCFADIKGQDNVVARVKSFMNNFPKKKALILSGPPGTGKTSLAYALSEETNLEIIELNASDLRDRESIKTVLKGASEQQSLFGKKGKILLVDEIDGITRDDRGGLPELILLINNSNFPLILTANDIWDKKFSNLRKKAEIIQIKEVDYKVIFNILKNISRKENFDIDDELLKSVAIKTKGDIRAAINDLQTLGKNTAHEDIHERDKKQDIFHTLKFVFQSAPSYETLRAFDKVNMRLDEIFLWVEENIPREYEGEALAKAIDAVSKADVFRGRIYRQQHWRFLVYENFLLSIGVSAAKSAPKSGFTKYQRPKRILKIWLMNQKLKYKKSIAEKYAKYTHTNKKRALREFSLIKNFLKDKDIQKQLKLDEKEMEFLEK